MKEKGFSARDARDTAQSVEKRLTGQLCGGWSISGYISAKQTSEIADKFVRSKPVWINGELVNARKQKSKERIQAWLKAAEGFAFLNPYGSALRNRF